MEEKVSFIVEQSSVLLSIVWLIANHLKKLNIAVEAVRSKLVHKLTAILYSNSASSLIAVLGTCSVSKTLKTMIFCVTSLSAFNRFT